MLKVLPTSRRFIVNVVIVVVAVVVVVVGATVVNVGHQVSSSPKGQSYTPSHSRACNKINMS